ncbi:MAG: glycerophosphodiester phosphodiesterase [Myxococcales bacterium]|nr:glycerophosphodiester phosphodiesterase [Myxococcales bacterium]
MRALLRASLLPLLIQACAAPSPTVTPAAPQTLDAQGHRGARGLAPENTWMGFETALAIGVTTLELDVVLTADGVPVVHHDLRLDPDRARVDGEWIAAPGPAIRARTLESLASVDVGRLRPGSAAARRFPQQRGADGITIPTLAEVIARAEERAAGRVRYNIELKGSPLEPELSPDPSYCARAVIEVVRAAGVEPRVTIQAFDWFALERARAYAPELARAYLTCEQPGDDTVGRGQPGPSPWLDGDDIDAIRSLPALIRARGGAVWSPCHADVDAARLADARARGLAVVVWTVNDPEDMRELIALGVDGIITDYPDRLRRVLIERGDAPPRAFAPAASPAR